MNTTSEIDLIPVDYRDAPWPFSAQSDNRMLLVYKDGYLYLDLWRNTRPTSASHLGIAV